MWPGQYGPSDVAHGVPSGSPMWPFLLVAHIQAETFAILEPSQNFQKS